MLSNFKEILIFPMFTSALIAFVVGQLNTPLMNGRDIVVHQIVLNQEQNALVILAILKRMVTLVFLSLHQTHVMALLIYVQAVKANQALFQFLVRILVLVSPACHRLVLVHIRCLAAPKGVWLKSATTQQQCRIVPVNGSLLALLNILVQPVIQALLTI